MSIALRRHALEDFAAAFRADSVNPGLLLRRGLSEWPGQDSRDGAGGAKALAVCDIAGLPASPGYRWAYRRWCETTADAARFDVKEMKLVDRLYIGVVRDNPIEAGVTVAHAWGMPLIPGSAIKGVTRDVARGSNIGGEALTHLFGSADDAHPESGAVVFHDAWWNPDKSPRPFVAEIVTPHHGEYYAQGKAHASDFDSPTPAPQIAVRGSFRFVIEGAPGWRELAMALAVRALTGSGIGGKTTSGYGMFQDNGDGGS